MSKKRCHVVDCETLAMWKFRVEDQVGVRRFSSETYLCVMHQEIVLKEIEYNGTVSFTSLK